MFPSKLCDFFLSVDGSTYVSEDMTDYVALCQAMVESVFGSGALDDDYIVNILLIKYLGLQ